jgi:hypothetical protein
MVFFDFVRADLQLDVMAVDIDVDILLALFKAVAVLW